MFEMITTIVIAVVAIWFYYQVKDSDVAKDITKGMKDRASTYAEECSLDADQASAELEVKKAKQRQDFAKKFAEIEAIKASGEYKTLEEIQALNK